MVADRSMKLVVGDMAVLTCQWRDICFRRSFLKVDISHYCRLMWSVMVDDVGRLVFMHVKK